MVALSIFGSGSITATVGMAWSSVHSRSLTPASSRARIPVTTTRRTAATATTPKMPNFRREPVGRCSVGGMRCLRKGVFGALLLVYHTKYHGNKHQRGDRCKDQTADHGAPQRRVLLTALAKAERHRQHAHNHRQCGHQHRTDADEACFDRGGDRVAEFLIALASEADHQHAVGGGDPHANDAPGTP